MFGMAPTLRRPPIVAGTVTIPWAFPHPPLPAGWVLPGGVRTQDENLARRVALNIDDMSKSVPPLPRAKLAEIRARCL